MIEEAGIRTLSRSLMLLDIVARTSPVPRKLVEIVSEAGLHKATAHRILGGLVAEGLLELREGGYVIGPRCWALGNAAAPRFDLSHIVEPYVREIAEETGDVGLFAVKMGIHARCVSRVEGSHPILPTSIQVGSVRPLGCNAYALAILAALPDDEMNHAISETRQERQSLYKFFTSDILLARVQETRRRGYALAQGEIVPGMVGLAIAVRDGWGNPVGAICCTAIEQRLPPDRFDAVAALLTAKVEKLEARLNRAPLQKQDKGENIGQA